MLRTSIGIVLACLMLGSVSAHPWSSYHGDPQHTGLSSTVVGDSIWIAWTYTAGGQISGSPVVTSANRIIFGARDVRLYCLKSEGTVDWISNTLPGSNIYFSTPALDDSGNIYVTTSQKLVKVDSAGNILWSWPTYNLSISHSPVIGNDGKIYFACYSDSLYALTPDGSLAWSRYLGNGVNSSPAVGHDGRIYVATTRGTGPWKLWAFNPDSTLAWSYDLAGDADFASPTVGPDSTIYVGANRYLYAIRPNGSLKWRDSLAARIQSCPAIANDSTLYVLVESWLYCVDTDSGVRWRKSISPSSFYSAPVVDAAGNVYIGSNNTFYVIAPDSTVLCACPLGVTSSLFASPAIGPNRRVYVGYMNNIFYAFEGYVPPVFDVGVTKIDSPPGSINYGTTVTPACSVYNYGNTTETYMVRMKIGTFYEESTQVVGHVNGAYTYVIFPS